MAVCNRFHVNTRIALQMTVLLLPLLCTFAFLACTEDDQVAPPTNVVDTTSHNFVWYTDTLGGLLSTVNDVFCISADDAWAVGYFYVLDSTGKPDEKLSTNAAHWNGVQWTFIKVNPLLNGYQTFAERNAVFAIAENDIWIETLHWNGLRWEAFDVNSISTGRTRKIWGERPDNVYFAGENGSMMHWNGQQFRQINIQPTTATNLDVWGWKDTAYVASSDPALVSGSRGYVTRVEQGKIIEKEIFDFNDQISVWGRNGFWFAGGCASIYQKSGVRWRPYMFPPQCLTIVRGTSLRNVYFLFQGGSVHHFNGNTRAEILQASSGHFFTKSMSAAGNAVFLCGSLNSYGVIKRGYQQPIK